MTLPPTSVAPKDAAGIVSVGIDGAALWLARPEALHGHEGELIVEEHAGPDGHAVSITGTGTAFLRSSGALIVIDLHDEETCVRASSLVAHCASGLSTEAADPEVVGHFDERIVRLSGVGTIVLSAPSELVAPPVNPSPTRRPSAGTPSSDGRWQCHRRLQSDSAGA